MKNVLLVFFLAPLYILAQVTLDWQEFTNGVAIATDASENVYTVSWIYNPGGDIILTKRDATGNFIWEAFYDNTDITRHEVATWVETDNDNNIIVTGTVRSGYASPVNAASIVMKFDPDGNLLWRNVYETDFDGSYTRKCLIDADNNIYVLGMGSGAPGFVTKVKKFATDGSALWSYFNSAGIGAALNFKFTPDNKIIITGRALFGSINGYAKIDLDGNEIWSYAGINSLTTGDAAGDLFGNTYLINGEYVAGTTGSILTKLSPSGVVIWDELNDMAGMRVETGLDHCPVISGFPNSGSAGAAFMKYDVDGNILWENPDADGADYGLLLHAMLKLDGANNAYLAAGTLFEMAICKINADGTQGWVAHCSGGYSNGFVFGNDYSVYVVGGTTAHFTQELIPNCESPAGLFTNNITTTKAKLNWAISPDAFQYEVWYKKATAANWKKKFVPGINNKLNLKNLVCNTNYVWKIRTICDTVGTDLISDFSPDQLFATAPCREEEIAREDNISIYPNPATDRVQINVGELTITGIRIIDLTGKVADAGFENIGGTIQLNLTHFPAGTYIISIQTPDAVINRQMIITK